MKFCIAVVMFVVTIMLVISCDGGTIYRLAAPAIEEELCDGLDHPPGWLDCDKEHEKKDKDEEPDEDDGDGDD